MAEHRGGSGNFAEDKEKASEAGRKGGQHSGGNFKMIPSVHLKRVKKVGRIATVADVNPTINFTPDIL
ncbi:Conidiation-specific protein 10 [Salmonella enterica]|nr:Conidiation-specific protein 10 [Salmonella enterica]